jgi:hypothetical protein
MQTPSTDEQTIYMAWLVPLMGISWKGNLSLSISAYIVFLLKTKAEELRDKIKTAFQNLFAPTERKPVSSITVGDNNSGPITINIDCPIYFTQVAPPPTTEPSSRSSA